MNEEFTITGLDAKPKHEPTADQRVMAQLFMGWYVAFREQGFTEAQALRLIGEVMRAGRDDTSDN